MKSLSKYFFNALAVSVLGLGVSVAVANNYNHKSSSETFTATFSPSNEAGEVTSPGMNSSGEGDFIYNPMTHKLLFDIKYKLSQPAYMAHFHLGAKGHDGPIIQTICGQPAPTLIGQCPDTDNATVKGVWKVPQKYRMDLQKGNIFINFHTHLNPKGELRAQLIPNNTH